jgi:hypothetical protein
MSAVSDSDAGAAAEASLASWEEPVDSQTRIEALAHFKSFMQVGAPRMNSDCNRVLILLPSIAGYATWGLVLYMGAPAPRCCPILISGSFIFEGYARGFYLWCHCNTYCGAHKLTKEVPAPGGLMQVLNQQPGQYSLDEFIRGAANAMLGVFPQVCSCELCWGSPPTED